MWYSRLAGVTGVADHLTWNSLPAKPNDFSSIARFTRFIKSADLSEFLSLGY